MSDRLRVAPAVTLAAIGLVATAPAAPAAAHARHAGLQRTGHAIRITARDFSFRIDTHGRHLAAGLDAVTLVNRGQAPHQALIARLHRGVTIRRFRSVMDTQGQGPALALIDMAGGANTVDPGGHQTTWQRLRAGRYVVICLVAGPDGRPHVMKGMLHSLRVVAPRSHAARRARRKPAGHEAGTIIAHDMTFKLPARFTGHGLYRFRDTSHRDMHELAILRLAPGKHRSDVVAWFRHPGPPPFTDAGGFGAVEPGGGGWLRLALPAGRYVAACFVPDDEPPHMPHGAMGMVVEFTVP